jgi:hypothetical protein
MRSDLPGRRWFRGHLWICISPGFTWQSRRSYEIKIHKEHTWWRVSARGLTVGSRATFESAGSLAADFIEAIDSLSGCLRKPRLL